MFSPKGGWKEYLCPTKDILEAYMATAQGIHMTLALLDKSKPLTMREAALIADRIREGRDLIHQVLTRRKHHKQMRKMLRINILQRDRLLKLAEESGLPADMLKGRCKTYAGTATPGMNTITKKGGDASAPLEVQKD